MRAALVTSYGSPPVCAQVPAPTAPDGHLVVDVVAAGLHPRVRSQASGSHYTSTGALPLVPGVDGVGRDRSGDLRYFVLDEEAPLGSMAESTVIDPRRSIVLPEGCDPYAVAAAMNPAMSAWVALRRRVEFAEGQSVLILGATGNAGRLAVQVARRLGAGRIIAAGRDAARLADLPGLGADATVSMLGDAGELADRLAETAADVDLVLDYVWGAPTASAMAAVVTARADRAKPLTWVEIGSVAGPTAAIPSAALRAARLQIVGSGQGSVGPREIVAELPALAAEITGGTFGLDVRRVPLDQVESAWLQPSFAGARVVIVP